MINLQTVADILGWTLNDVEVASAEAENAFMPPDVVYLPGSPDSGSYLDPFDPRHEDTGPGYYARLSAPGYLDCTAWAGPFETVNHAYAYLLGEYYAD